MSRAQWPPAPVWSPRAWVALSPVRPNEDRPRPRGAPIATRDIETTSAPRQPVPATFAVGAEPAALRWRPKGRRRAGAAPTLRSPSRTASEAIRFAARAASSGSSRARAGRRAPRSACSPSRGPRRPRSARPRSRTSRSPSKKTSVASARWPPVTTTASGPSAWTARTRASGVRSAPAAPASTAASGRFGRDDGRARESCARAAPRCASSSSSRAPLSATITGSSTTGALADEVERLDHRLDRLARAEHPDLDRVDADVLGDGPHLLDDRSPAAPDGRRRRRRCSAR